MGEVHSTQTKRTWPDSITRQIAELDVLQGTHECIPARTPRHTCLQPVCDIRVIVIAATWSWFEKPPPFDACPSPHIPDRRRRVALAGRSEWPEHLQAM
jgi:hypothetical protein